MYQKYTGEVKVWNDIMQNGPADSDKGNFDNIRRQSAFVKEEGRELFDAAQIDDLVEIIDGHLDTRFVNDQVGVYLEAMGVDLEGAWDEVCRSNNSKFSTDVAMLEQSVLKYLGEGVPVVIVESPVKGTFVLKRCSDGKIMKPIAFSEPNLRPFIPKHLRGPRNV